MGRKSKKKRIQPQGSWSLRKGDEVVVVTGDDAGTRGKILLVDRRRNRVVVEGVNRVKRHQKPSTKNPQGGVIEKELSIHVSNVMLWDKTDQRATRVGRRVLDDGRRVRVARSSGDTVEG